LPIFGQQKCVILHLHPPFSLLLVAILATHFQIPITIITITSISTTSINLKHLSLPRVQVQ
jgi:hypothetical protein